MFHVPPYDPADGNYFRRAAYVVYPKLPRVIEAYITTFERAQAEIQAYERAHPTPPDAPAWSEPLTDEQAKLTAQALDKSIRASVERLAETEPKLYNAQPDWRMKDISVGSGAEADAILREFFHFAEYASDAFGWWRFSFPKERGFPKGKDWMRHGWKHITPGDLEEIAGRVKSGNHPLDDLMPPIDLLPDSHKEREALFRNAARGVPEAVARLHFLFPTESDKREAAEYSLGLPRNEIAQLLSQIPSPGALAAQWAHVAVRRPDSDEAAEARRGITALIAKSSARGSKVGRPKIPFSVEMTVTVYRMSYVLYKQLREVDRFLKKLISGDDQRSQKLGHLYPWLARELRPDRTTNFATHQPTEGA